MAATSTKGLVVHGVALALKRDLVLGELNSPHTAALSIAVALGGMLVPAGFYCFASVNLLQTAQN